MSVLTDMSYQYITRMSTAWHDASEMSTQRGLSVSMEDSTHQMLHAMGIDNVSIVTQHHDLHIRGLSTRLQQMKHKLQDMKQVMTTTGWKQEEKTKKEKERKEWMLKREEYENKIQEEEKKREEEEKKQAKTTTTMVTTTTTASSDPSTSKLSTSSTAMTDDSVTSTAAPT